MKIILAQHYGICFGVRDAIAQAEALGNEALLTILGELVHNPIVRERLRSRGIQESTADQVHGHVMITAHGVSDTRRAALERRGLNVTDGTCPLVRHAHTVLKQLVAEGYFPVVIGMPGHVEVRGLTEDFPGAFVLSEPDDIADLPKHCRYGVISQTTQPIERVRWLVEQIRLARPESEVRFVDTVCKPTKDRQHALKELLEAADTVVVVGGRHSNNTRQLVETCRAAGRRAIHIERPEELAAADFTQSAIVGVTAGTSTLRETVASVVEQLCHIAEARP